MNVLHVITDLRPGGAQDNTILTANEQAKRGHRVTVAAGPYRSRHDLLDTRVRWLEVKDLVREIHPLRDFRAALMLRAILGDDRDEPDVVHTHLSKAAALVRLVAPPKRTIVHTIHTFPFHPLQIRVVYGVHVALERRLARRTARYVAVAPNNIERALQLGIGVPDQYRVVYSGMDVARISSFAALPRPAAKARLGLPAGIIVGTLGRLVPQKNPLCFLDAAALIARRVSDVSFVVVGDGPLRFKAEAYARQQRVAVRFVGEQSNAPLWLRSFDVVVHTSEYEGMGRVLGEAMLVRTPLVATVVDGVRDAIGKDERGWGVPPREPAAISDAVENVLGSPDRTRAVTDGAFTWATSNLSATAMIDGLEAVYAEVRNHGDRHINFRSAGVN